MIALAIMETTTGAVSVLRPGFGLGLKHALDADHVVAVSTIVGERKGMWSSSLVGVFWGFGHTAALLIVGMLMIALRVQIPDRLALMMEMGVALMLIGLGINVVYKLTHGARLHMHIHTHEGVVHAHPHVHEAAHEHAAPHHQLPFSVLPQKLWDHFAKAKRSVIIGMIHGLAGSAGLMLIVLATIPSPVLGVAYISIFGLGSIGGMMIMSTLIGIPFVYSARKSDKLNYFIRGFSGILSIVFGLFYAWHVATVEGLLF